MKKYIETKKQCQAKIKGVCEGCGRKLKPLETVDNAGRPTFWIGCKHCLSFRSGIEKRYWKIARELVEKDIIKPYSHLSKSDYSKSKKELEYYYDSQCAGLSHKIKLIEKMLNES